MQDDATVQDNQREKQVIKLFEPVIMPRKEKERDPKAPPDATYVGNGDPIEIKCCTKKNRSISTVHGFTKRHLKRFQSRHMLIAVGPNLATGFKIERLFYAHPQTHLRDWLDKLTSLFDEHDQIIEYMIKDKDFRDFRPEKVHRLRQHLELSLNDPTIPWRIVQNCEELHDDPREQLCCLIERHPLNQPAEPKSFADGLISWT